MLGLRRLATRIPAAGMGSARFASTITMDAQGKLHVPNDPIIPFIEGDGTGPDIWKSSVAVFNAAGESLSRCRGSLLLGLAQNPRIIGRIRLLGF